MDYIKLKFLADHSLSEALSYELSSLGAEGVSVVDKNELSSLYKDQDELNYAMDEYLDTLPEEAQVEAFFYELDSPESQSAEGNPILLVNVFDDYKGELYEEKELEHMILSDLLASLQAEMISYSENLGGAYEFVGYEIVKEEDWANNWKTYYAPVSLSPRVTIVPSWIDYEQEKEDEVIVRIDPGQAFGTGYHETTELCAFYIDDIQARKPNFYKEARILDLGTGSGILAIILAQMGASDLDAIDIDPKAVEVAGENFASNGIEFGGKNSNAAFELYTGELKDTDGGYDLIVANLVAGLHLVLAGDYRRKLLPGGRIILSGIIDDKMQEVRDALADHGLILEEARFKNDWWTLIAARKEDLAI